MNWLLVFPPCSMRWVDVFSIAGTASSVLVIWGPMALVDMAYEVGLALVFSSSMRCSLPTLQCVSCLKILPNHASPGSIFLTLDPVMFPSNSKVHHQPRQQICKSCV